MKPQLNNEPDLEEVMRRRVKLTLVVIISAIASVVLYIIYPPQL